MNLYIPTWPHAFTSYDKIGAPDYGNSSCGSVYVSFRARPKTDEYEGDFKFRVWQNLALYIWFDAEGTVIMYLKAKGIFSADIYELEKTLKTLKAATKKFPEKRVTLETLPFALAEMCTALGIKQTIEYHGISQPDTFAEVQKAIALVVKEVQRRFNQLERSQS